MKFVNLSIMSGLFAAATWAGPVQVTSAAALGANDSIVWGQFGAAGTLLTPIESWTSTDGLTGTVNDTVAPELQAASSVSLTTDPVYDDQYPPTEGVNITFDSPVEGAGVLVMNEFGSSQFFGYVIQAFGASGLIALYEVDSPQVANTPTYLGILDTSFDIKSIYITVGGYAGNTGNYFALDTVNVLDDVGAPQASQTPEPSSLLLAAPAILVLIARKRKLSAAAEC